MFYTKYRPQQFSQISRPNKAADALATQIKSGKTAHAYLFIGPRGTGKTTTARILAKALNCENPLPTGDVCAQCTYCTQIQSGGFLDLIEIDAASNRGIDDIRSLRDKVKLAPVYGKTKVYIIDEVHMLTSEAFNALLKTLEEPPKYVVFILCTTEDHKVPETIKSRCQVYKFSRATTAQIVYKLEEICKTEGTKVQKKDLEKIAKMSNGGFRDAENLLEQFIESGGLYLDDGKTSAEEFVHLVLNKHQKLALDAIQDLYKQGVDIFNFSSSVIYYCRDLLLLSSGIEKENLSDDVKNLVARTDIIDISKLLNLLLDAHNKIKQSVLPQLPIELAVVTFCATSSRPEVTRTEPKQKPKPKPSSDEDDIFDTTLTLEMIKQTNVPEESQPNDSNSIPTEEEVLEDISAIEQSMEDILSKWDDIINTASQINNSVTAILKACKPIKVDGEYLVLEVLYKFHKERLESTKNRELVEQALKAHISAVKSIKCVLTPVAPKVMSKFESGELTDLNISPVGHASINKDNANGFFDGGLPMA
jgi:DNA polymerase-3 subunit gamma/tau